MWVGGTRWQTGASKRVDTHLEELFLGSDKSHLKVGVILTEEYCHCAYGAVENGLEFAEPVWHWLASFRYFFLFFFFFPQSTVKVCGSVKITQRKRHMDCSNLKTRIT